MGEREDQADLETCSWCLTEVPYKSLREQKDGAMICRRCRQTL